VIRSWSPVVAALSIGLTVVACLGASASPDASAGRPTSPLSATSDASPSTPGESSVTVGSIPALLAALADDSISEIVVADGTYHVSPASDQKPDSLWIGEQFAARTNPVTVRAETRGGVTFDGGGADYFGCISFEQGAHDQTWDGFDCANGVATQTGVVTFGGLGTSSPGSPNHITMRYISILASCRGSSQNASSPTLDHAFYIADATSPGPHDLRFENISVDGRGGLASAFQFFHSVPGAPNASNVTITGLDVVGTQEAIILADPTLRNITIESATITNALLYAVFYETTGAQGIVLSQVTSTGSGSGRGFFSTQGPSPPGIDFFDTSLH